MVIGWDNVDNLEDYFITYLLYRDSLTVPQISRIRNISQDEVNLQLITAKTELRSLNRQERNTNDHDVMVDYLSLSKQDRIEFLDKLSDSDKNFFKRQVYKGILKTNNVEDLMVLVWTVGEFKDHRFLNILYPLTQKNHSNLRRISYSAIGKIASTDSSFIIEMGLMDDNPQIRQYCAKFLGDIGSKDSIRVLENILKNKADFEKDYVLRACTSSLEKLYSKYKVKK
nr:HEAT repeat domain-containing protein [uncultured Peptostreptococcus sp.]